jgi:hypothetical protein
MGKGDKLVANSRRAAKRKAATDGEAAIGVLRELLEQFRKLAKAVAPGSVSKPNKFYDASLFATYSRFVLDIARTLTSYEVAKPVAAPATLQAAISFEANVSVGQRDAPKVNFEAMSDADLTR